MLGLNGVHRSRIEQAYVTNTCYVFTTQKPNSMSNRHLSWKHLPTPRSAN